MHFQINRGTSLGLSCILAWNISETICLNMENKVMNLILLVFTCAMVRTYPYQLSNLLYISDKHFWLIRDHLVRPALQPCQISRLLRRMALHLKITIALPLVVHRKHSHVCTNIDTAKSTKSESHLLIECEFHQFHFFVHENIRVSDRYFVCVCEREKEYVHANICLSACICKGLIYVDMLMFRSSFACLCLCEYIQLNSFCFCFNIPVCTCVCVGWGGGGWCREEYAKANILFLTCA